MLSICIIVKNEADNLKICLSKLHKLGYEIIVVDTGSTDNTKEIAEIFTDKLYDFPWCDDFSAARNFAISKASFDYILIIDSDEFVINLNKPELEKLLSEHPKDIGRIHISNSYTHDGVSFCENDLVSRIFSRKYFHYTGKIHEQLTAFNGEIYNTYLAPVYMNHVGYNGNSEAREKKAERNIKLLEKVLMEEGNDPYILYQLGKGFYMQKKYSRALEYFEKAIEFDLNPKLEYVTDLVETYGYTLINCKQFKKALSLESIYEEFSYSADFVYLMGHVYMQNSMFDKAIIEFNNATEYKECKVQGVNSYLALYNLGVIYECLGDKKNALYCYRKCGNYELARQGIIRCS